MAFNFSVLGAPRTKKNSSRVVRAGGFTKVLPSKAFTLWHKEASSYALLIKTLLREQGADLPITERVNVAAVFFCDRYGKAADAVGLYQAIADWMEDVGILENDRQIITWNGSRVDSDKVNPRTEVSIEVIG
jgi:hypothetical protein